jgi:cellulose synthase/poly-beta-1,6-N-acetylglucosamine synthase-like glycosyltransferase
MKTKTIPVAVLLCVYSKDNPLWFASAIASIVNQSYGIENIRIYLGVDGEISSELNNVIKNYNAYLYKVRYFPENQGLASTLNKLISTLENEKYIFRADSDDISVKERIYDQVVFMEKNPAIGICGTAIIEVEGNGIEFNRRFYHSDHHILVGNIFKGSLIAHATACFRKKALTIIGPYNQCVGSCEDIELWFRAIKKGVLFSNLEKPLYIVRTTDSFFDRRSVKKSIQELKIYWKGCRMLFNYSWRLIFPVLRFISRLQPRFIVRFLYESKIRHLLYR